MLDFADDIDSQITQLQVQPPLLSGKLVRMVGLTLEAKGIIAPLGAHCRVENIDMGTYVDAEVVGFNDDVLYLMPFSEPTGIGPGARVWVISRHAKASLGEAMLGRVVDGLGEPIDGRGPIAYSEQLGLEGLAINPMERGPINKILDTGIKAINTCLTLGQGQRIGLVAGSGVGKSVLLGMLTRNTAADVVVIGLIGERGREVQEFIQHTLGDKGLAKSVVVAAPANVSPVLRLKATYLTHLVAEYFRDRGKNVLMLCDSLTRVAHAQREIGLAIGEPPTAKGYPPSVFAMLPRLIERSGVGRHGHGSITAMYTVLAEGDDRADPIVDIARASLDGQVLLSRTLADAAHYPAIDLSGSISRVMSNLVNSDVLKAANHFRRLWSLYQQNEDLIQVGAYEAGTNPDLDHAIRLRPGMEAILRQASDESVPLEQSQKLIMQLVAQVKP
jgi:flagellum-specific ATP synthase